MKTQGPYSINANIFQYWNLLRCIPQYINTFHWNENNILSPSYKNIIYSSFSKGGKIILSFKRIEITAFSIEITNVVVSTI